MRRTLGELRKSLVATNIGLCVGDIPSISAIVNQAQEQLIYAGGEFGFWGGWWRTVFNVTTADPYITCPRTIARIARAAVCQDPVNVENEWYEMQEASAGPLPGTCCDVDGQIRIVDRGSVPTAYDVPDGAYYIRAYYTDTADIGKRVLTTALDQNGNGIYSTDGTKTVEGFYLTLAAPFVTSSMTVTKITGVQKDETYGDVLLYAVDTTTGTETFLSRMMPFETVASYRRYYINQLPSNCCTSTPGSTQVTTLAKLEFIPAWRDTDYLIIGNIPALIEEVRSIRHGNMDSKEMKELSMVEHRAAVKHLNNELRHYTGELRPAVRVNLYGTAKGAHRRIGAMM